MECLQIRKIPGKIYIGCGFIRGKLTGIYYDILGQVGGRLAAGRSHRRVTAGTPTRRGVPFTRVKGTKTRLGLCPKTPLPLSCGWIRIGLFSGS